MRRLTPTTFSIVKSTNSAAMNTWQRIYQDPKPIVAVSAKILWLMEAFSAINVDVSHLFMSIVLISLNDFIFSLFVCMSQEMLLALEAMRSFSGNICF
jgi:hypothetical protein